MIIFGTTHLKTGTTIELPGIECPCCGNDQRMIIRRRTSFFHLYFIPLIPYEGQTLLICRACDAEFQAPYAFRRVYEGLRDAGTLTPENFYRTLSFELSQNELSAAE